MDTDIDRVFKGKLFVTIKEAVTAGIGGRSSIYDQIASGDLEARKDGKSLRITVSSIRRRIAGLPIATVRPCHPPKPSASRAVKPTPQPKKRARGTSVRRRT
jgi:hypothetical protein